MGQGVEITQQLLDNIREKQEIVEKLASAIKIQHVCFQDNTLDEERFERIDKKKDQYLARMNQLMEQTESIEPAAKKQLEQLIQNQDPRAEEIHKESRKLQEQIQQLEAEEEKLKEEFQKYLGNERKKIKDKRFQRATAAKYYKNMTKQTDMMSYFYDRKK